MALAVGVSDMCQVKGDMQHMTCDILNFLYHTLTNSMSPVGGFLLGYLLADQTGKTGQKYKERKLLHVGSNTKVFFDNHNKA